MPTGPDEWRAPAGTASRVLTARPDPGAVAARELDRYEVANIVTRRSMMRTAFWSTLGVTLAGFLLGFVNFFWPRKVTGFGGIVTVPSSQVPQAGADPVKIFTAKAWIVNLPPGGGVPPEFVGTAKPSEKGGILALYQKCPHLGCTVPWRPEFEFEGVKGWFRCPCHGSTYTKAGVRVFGPAPRPMDTMAVTVKADGSLEINTGQITLGGPDNPQRTVQLT
jgi:cytochrome b6-f complex iron-sulfur subunit